MLISGETKKSSQADIARANALARQLARDTGLTMKGLYKTMSVGGNPSLPPS